MSNEGFFKAPAKGYNSVGVHTGPGPWLNVIWATNKVEPDFFGAPIGTGTRRDGECVETYEAR